MLVAAAVEVETTKEQGEEGEEGETTAVQVDHEAACKRGGA
jgi:hypothetical protein